MNITVRGVSIVAASIAAIFAGSAGGGAALAADTAHCIKIAGSEAVKATQTMDPALLWAADDAMHIRSVYEPLIEVDQDFNLHPRLALSWESNQDGTQWTFHLRQGVKFHTGKEFTADDVVYTYHRLLDPKTASPSLSQLSFLSDGDIVAIDKYTVKFTTKKPTAELPTLISDKQMLIVPVGATKEQLATGDFGTGPFKVELFERGGPVRILRRNADYWDTGLPKAECLKITANDQPLSLVAQLRAGEVDVAPQIDATAAATLKGDPKIDIVVPHQGSILNFAMKIDEAPFNDKRVREAFKLLVDRAALANIVTLGYGSPANDSPIPPFLKDAYSAQIPVRDIDKAKALLAAAGQPNLTVDLFTADTIPGTIKMATAFAQMAADAGVTVNVQQSTADVYWDNIYQKRSFYTSGWTLRPTGVLLAISLRSTAAWNETNWKVPAFDALLDEASATLDPDKRRALYQQAQKMVAEEGGVIFPVFSPTLAAVSKACSGFVPQSANTPDFRQLTCGN